MIFSYRILFTGVLFLFFLAIATMALFYSADARLGPLVVSLPGLILCFFQLVTDWRQINQETGQDELEQGANALTLYLYFLALIVITLVFGIMPAAALFIFVFLYKRGNYNMAVSIAVACGFTSLLYLIFEIALNLELFRGLLIPWIA